MHGPAYEDIGDFFDAMAPEEDRWLEKTGGYHRLVQRVCGSLIPTGQRVLEIGSGRGDLLASVAPARGVGVDISGAMVSAARRTHPDLEFHQAAGEGLDLGETFDYVVLSDLVPYVHDLQDLFASVAAHCHARTRVVVTTYSNVWRPLLTLLSVMGLRPRRPIRNWVGPEDLVNLLELSGFQVTAERKEILVPVTGRRLPRYLNGYLARLPGVRSLALTHWLVARPLPERAGELGVSVVVPCRNEAGSIRDLVDRIPEMGTGTEIVFVEGNSSDHTRATIEACIEERPDRDVRLVIQDGTGKWNAVQGGFAAASNEVLMILDGDMTVAPEELPKFYAAIAGGHGELINGSRLVYGMESGAMRFLNMLGNKLFAGWLSRILGQYVKDTLCGTKVLLASDYERIASRRGEFGIADPFGDFELLLGAALLGLKIANVPVRYRARIYGDTNIRRFHHGWMLMRLALAGYERIWVRPVAR